MTPTTEETALDLIDHIAIQVPNIDEAILWYTKTFKCKVEYRDATWAYLRFGNILLALVVPEQHPSHIAFTVEHAERFGPLKQHRDGTLSTYVNDPAGNAVEIVDRQHLPTGE
jgi:catechol 2,3-dioxygenase-like lactoylglutathione lyase family enzyme